MRRPTSSLNAPPFPPFRPAFSVFGPLVHNPNLDSFTIPPFFNVLSSPVPDWLLGELFHPSSPLISIFSKTFELFSPVNPPVESVPVHPPPLGLYCCADIHFRSEQPPFISWTIPLKLNQFSPPLLMCLNMVQ